MSMDQCHSTVGELSTKKPRVSHAGVGVTGRKYWRSLDDLADTPAFREFLEREFPNNASRLLDSSRRTFLKLMGASVALAGAATLPGCRRPDHKILPYSKSVPEEIIPGKPLYYATTLPLPGGEVEGVLVETHEGRPTKIEGNPLHPINNGKSTLWSQASILSLYDPDRLKDPVYTREGTTARSWADFDAWGSKHFAGLGVKQGEGLCFLVEKRLSPSRDAVKTALLKKFPKAKWLSYDPLQADEMFAGLAAAVGQPCRELFRLENADVVVSFDRDFLGLEAGQLVNTRGFASRRRAESGSMSRLYSIESAYSITGGRADHRLRLSPALVTMAVVALAKELVAQGAAKMTPALSAAIGAINIPSVGKALDMAFIVEVAKDLAADEQGRSRAGKTLVCAGASQPRAVHALVAALNASMGNVGKTVDYVAVPAEFGASSAAALSELAADLDAGKVDTLVCVGVNPAYDAPGELGLAKKLEKAAHRIVASVETTETSEMAHWRLPMSHWLEAWGDTVALDGTVGAIQPMIAPLYGTRSDIEILGGIAGVGTDGHEIVRGAWRDVLKMGDLAGFERTWKRALHDGVGQRGAPLPSTVGAAMGDNAARMVSDLRLEAPRDDEFEVVVIAGNAGDGRFANNPWLQEIPDATNKIVWDNVAMISRATAEKFGLEQEKETLEVRHARMMTVSVGGRSIDIAAWLTPGIPDNTIVIAAGYGRTACGLVGTGVGFGVHGLLSAGNLRRVGGAKIARAGGGAEKYPITCTQAHGSMEGRAIVREADFEAWKTFGEDPFHGFSQEEKDRVLKDPYGNARAITFGNNEGRLNFAEMLGELLHAPANVNAYMNPQRGTKDQGAAAVGVHGSASTGKPAQPNTAVDFSKGPQWGMTIDLSTCTGCNACTIACQAENNIAVVGKREANKHREMHWIRVDRYFAGDVDSPGVMYQPVLCVQCENAPCETVCPVNATVHGPEGINYMVYNRCIGTRYCANNCPYKVRRFNFFEYGAKKFNGSYIGKESLNEMGVEGPKNPNLVPPRLRQQIDNISKLQKNPDVTVRSRGVMEKCTFCVQRLNEARIEMKLQNLRHIPDGFVQVACQQACPSDAIVFGDILDTKSRVSKERGTARAYMLLGYLNTRPRVLHLMGVRNPNPKLCDPQRVASWSHPYHHGGHEEDHDAGHGGGEHGAASHGSAARNLFDPAKRLEDAGYRLSLAVLAT